MNKDLRDKIKTISFILVVLVVFTHANNLAINYSSETVIVKKGVNWFLQNAISDGFAKIASPLFFSISGFLFFLSIQNGNLSEYPAKYRKRFKTLVIPYLLWSIYGVLLFLVLQSLPFSRGFFTHELIVNLSFTQLLNTIFFEPIPYHLWFVSDLMMLVLISPLLYWAISYFKYYVLLLFTIFWINDLDFVLFISRSLLFFSLGAYLSINKVDMNNIKSNKSYILLLLWFTLVFIKTYLNYIDFENTFLIILIQKLSILIGIVTIWTLYDKFFKNKEVSKSKFYMMFQYTFFIFASHEPTLTIIKKGLNFIMKESELSSFIGFISAPIITISISILIAFYLKKVIPKFYYLLTGGR